jgi:hypothetical protein
VRHACATAAASGACTGERFGVQRRHARNPARSAASQLSKKRTFSRRALRDVQDGRQ